MKSCRLIYRSVAEADLANRESALSKLVNQASNNNRRMNITGMLLVSDGRFLQVLEGIPKFVNQIYAKIIQDRRHHDIELISYEGDVKSEFVDWDMRLLNLNNIDESVRTLLEVKYPMINNKFQFLDDAFLMTSLLMDIKHIHQK